MSEMIFELVGQRMMPVLPSDERSADNVRFFTLPQAAEKIGGCEDELSDEWFCYFPSDQVEPDESETRALLAAAPKAEDVVRSAISSARLRVLHVVRFPHLSDEHWEYVVSDCQRRRIDPSLIWVKLEANDNGRVVPIIITTIAAFRLIAERSGQRDGECPPKWCGRDGVWTDVWLNPDEPPYAARVAVLKKGIDQPFEGIAYWKTHAQYHVRADGFPVLERMWEIGGPFMLAKCASALAHREAWPDDFADLYTQEEISPPKRRSLDLPISSMEAAAAVIENVPAVIKPPMMCFPDDPSFAWRLVDETTPENVARLQLDLMEAGVSSHAKAAAVVSRFRQTLPRLFGGHLKAFCAAVLKCVRENPAAYDLPAL